MQQRIPTYGPLVSACATYGIKRSKAYELAKSGLIDTFLLCGKKRFVYLASLDTLPERMAAASEKVASDVMTQPAVEQPE